MKQPLQQQNLFDPTPFLVEPFATESPINRDKITGQNKIVFEYLEKGKTLTSMQAIKKWGITRLGARIYDLRRIGNVTIYDKTIKEAGSDVKIYSMEPFKTN